MFLKEENNTPNKSHRGYLQLKLKSFEFILFSILKNTGLVESNLKNIKTPAGLERTN